MRTIEYLRRTAACAAALLVISTTPAEAALDFSGSWTLDLRSAKERQDKVECGSASFVLVQAGNTITGNHSFATPGCGRVNDGGQGSVTGVVEGNVATLTVTSARNGAVFVGTAEHQGNSLVWKVLRQVRAGTPETDSALVLQKGALVRAAK